MPDTMPRYMRAAKWNFEDAKKRIQGTMEWRREFKPDLIPPDEVCKSLNSELRSSYELQVKIEAETGKM